MDTSLLRECATCSIIQYHYNNRSKLADIVIINNPIVIKTEPLSVVPTDSNHPALDITFHII